MAHVSYDDHLTAAGVTQKQLNAERMQIEQNRQMFRDRDSGSHPQREQLRIWIAQRKKLELLVDGSWRLKK